MNGEKWEINRADNQPVSYVVPADGTPPIRYAGFWLRLVGELVDAFTFSIIWFLFLAVEGSLISLFVSEEFAAGISRFFGLLILLFNIGTWFIVGALYSVIFWARFGATPGKMLLGVKITKDDGSAFGYRTAIIRWFAQYVSLIPLFAGYIWVGIDKRKQGFHDKLARTVVIRVLPHAKARILLAIALIIVLGSLDSYLIPRWVSPLYRSAKKDTVSVPFEKWETFSSSRFGYEVKHPPAWFTLFGETGEDIPSVTFSYLSGELFNPEIRLTIWQNRDIEQILRNILSVRGTEIMREETTVNGMRAVRYQYTKGALLFGIEKRNILIEHLGNVYKFSVNNDHPAVLEVFDGMISTFRFKEMPTPSQNTPVIKSISPSFGAVGTKVIITASGMLEKDIGRISRIKFGEGYALDLSAYFDRLSSTAKITFTIPSALSSCGEPPCPRGSIADITVTPGTYQVSVITSKGASNSVPFVVK